MTVEVRIVGFDQRERVAFEAAIPAGAVSAVKKIAGVPASDPDLTGSYRLKIQQVREIADAAHISVAPARFTYFLEATV